MIEHLARWQGGMTPSIAPLAEAIRDLSIRLYQYGAAVTARNGVLLADTKFEFGLATTGDLDAPFGPPERIRRPGPSARPSFRAPTT